MAYELLQGRHVSLSGPVDATALVFAIALLLAVGIIVYQLAKLRYHQPVRWRLLGCAGGVALLLAVVLGFDPKHQIGFLYTHAQVVFWGMLATMLVVAALAWMLSTAICQDRVARQRRQER